MWRALTPAAWGASHACLERQLPAESLARLQWLCVFGRAAGGHAGHLFEHGQGFERRELQNWQFDCRGRNRLVPRRIHEVSARFAEAQWEGMQGKVGAVKPQRAA